MSLIPDYPPSVFDKDGVADWPVGLTPLMPPQLTPADPSGLGPNTELVFLDRSAVPYPASIKINAGGQDVPAIRFTVSGPIAEDGKRFEADMIMTLPAAEAVADLPLAIGVQLAKFVRQIVEAHRKEVTSEGTP